MKLVEYLGYSSAVLRININRPVGPRPSLAANYYSTGRAAPSLVRAPPPVPLLAAVVFLSCRAVSGGRWWVVLLLFLLSCVRPPPCPPAGCGWWRLFFFFFLPCCGWLGSGVRVVGAAFCFFCFFRA